jgi:3-methyladenine DNA glycosylase AlkD
MIKEIKTICLLKTELKKNSNKEKALILQRFFKTGKGEYGEGDIFLGITVPRQREIVKNLSKKFEISLDEIKELIYSRYHEYRFTGFLFLLEKYEKTKNREEKENYFNFSIKNVKQFNNWDLVDVIVPKLIGHYIFNYKKQEGKKILLNFAKSDNLWEKRVSIISTFYFIRNNEFDLTLEIADILLNDNHDLIHKAVGWMLREIGNRDLKTEENFLLKNNNYKKMPRTMLRYAIEKFKEDKRKRYMSK